MPRLGGIVLEEEIIANKLPDILSSCGPNIGGLLECVRLYPVSNVRSLPPVLAGQHVGTVQVRDVQNYMDVWFQPGSGQFEEAEDESDQGNFFKPKLSLRVGKDDPDLAASLVQLRRYKYFVAIYLDANGLTKLVGTLETPLRFLGSFDTGQKGNDKNGHQLSFSGETAEPAAFYQALIVPAGGVRRTFSSGFTFGFQRT